MFTIPTILEYSNKHLNYIINKKTNPLISVITISKNSEKTIKKTILSVKNQTYDDFEYIIIDSKSTDNTLKIINEHSSKIHRLISEEDKNPSDAINKGIAVSKGEIIFWLASDDWIKEDTLSIIANNYYKNKNSVFFYGNMIMHHKDVTKKIIPKINTIEMLLKGVPEFPYPAIAFNKTIFLKYGLFSTDLKINNDFEFVLRVLKKNRDVKYIEGFDVDRLPGGIGEKHQLKNLYETLKINYYYKNITLVFIIFYFSSILKFSLISIKSKLIFLKKLNPKKFFHSS